MANGSVSTGADIVRMLQASGNAGGWAWCLSLAGWAWPAAESPWLQRGSVEIFHVHASLPFLSGPPLRALQVTFGAHQVDPHRLRAATRAALRDLQAGKRLIELCPRDNAWGLTPKGRSVFDSSLPLHPAMELYDSLKQAEQGIQLGSPLALVYHALLAEQLPFEVQGWTAWQQMLAGLSKEQR